MIQKIFFLLFMVGFSACSAQEKLIGKYSNKGKDFFYELELNADSTFILTQKQLEVTSKCQGTWESLSDGLLLLKCSEVKDVIEKLTSGYMSEREKRATVLSRKKIKLQQVVLRRVKG